MTSKTNTLGERIKGLRVEKNLSQQQVADATMMHRSRISELEQDKVDNPRDDTIERLAVYFNADPKWIRYGDDLEHFKTDEETSDVYSPKKEHIKFKEKQLDVPTKLSDMMDWIKSQDDGRDYWAWVEMEFSEKFPDYRRWLKEKQDVEREKSSKTGTDY